MADARTEAFSLSHAQVLDGATTFLTALGAAAAIDEDIYGVNESSLEPDLGDFENEGDDVVMSTWSWLNYAEISVQAGYLSFPLIANITGSTLTSSGAGATQTFEIPLWHEDSMNVPPKPMIVQMPSKDAAGAIRRLVVGLYKVQFRPITFDGPAYKDGLKVNYNGRALQSPNDETGTVFPDGKKRVGVLLSIGA